VSILDGWAREILVRQRQDTRKRAGISVITYAHRVESVWHYGFSLCRS
jgi:hypothetical protein